MTSPRIATAANSCLVSAFCILSAFRNFYRTSFSDLIFKIKATGTGGVGRSCRRQRDGLLQGERVRAEGISGRYGDDHGPRGRRRQEDSRAGIRSEHTGTLGVESTPELVLVLWLLLGYARTSRKILFQKQLISRPKFRTIGPKSEGVLKRRMDCLVLGCHH